MTKKKTEKKSKVKVPVPVTGMLALALATSLGLRLAAEVQAIGESDPVDELRADERGAMEKASALDELFGQLTGKEAEVEAERERLEVRSRELAEREIQLRAAVDELNAAQAELKELIGIADEAARRDVEKLVALYERMKPKDSSPVFEIMDEKLAAGFLSKMSPDAAARILGGLSPEKSYSISVVLSGRNVSLSGSGVEE